MKRTLSLAAVVVLAAACSGGGDDGPRPLERIDGPAQLDPDFRDNGGADDRTDSGG